MTSSTISTVLTTTQVTLGSTADGSPLTITSSGGIEYASPAFAFPGETDIALTMPIAGAVYNFGKITETVGHDGNGFEAVLINGSSTLNNSGVVIGQAGAIPGGAGSAAYGGGTGVDLTAAGASLLNTGTVTGGAGGYDSTVYGYGGTGGYGAAVSIGGNVVNSSSITGGRGGGGAFVSKFSGGVGGAGIKIEGGDVLNNTGGVISGGAGGIGNVASVDGVGGVGAFFVSGSLTNDGTIIGGAGMGGRAAGAGLYMASGTVTNAGDIRGGTGTIGGAGATIAGGVLDNMGTISGSGTSGLGVQMSSGVLVNSGTIIGGGNGQYAAISASTLVIEQGAVFIGAVNAVDSDSQLTLASGTGTISELGSGWRHIDFEAGASWTLESSNFGSSEESFTGFGLGDTLVLQGFTETSEVVQDGTLVTLTGLDEQVVFEFDSGASDLTISSDGLGDTIITLCFYPGTRLATPQGEVAVEALRTGDMVLTANGAKPVRWLGRSEVSTRFSAPLRVLPIRIKASALGVDLPLRDLLLSPDHALFLDGVLVQAGALVNGVDIIREHDVPERFTYYHVELETHELLLAEGALAESFVDNVDRMAFCNWAERPSDEPICELPFPRVKSARQLPIFIRRKLAGPAAA